jgi:hypothetical protein
VQTPETPVDIANHSNRCALKYPGLKEPAMTASITPPTRVELEVEAFVATDENGSSVHVRTDSDLAIKFKRGEVAPNDTGAPGRHSRR